MEAIFDLVLVSAFGRGNWLASELTAQGLKAALVDVSQQMGRWSPEDWEGPFGCFDSIHLEPSQRARLVEDQETIPLEKGFCIWLKEGPVEFRSPITSFYMKKLGLSQTLIDYLTEQSTSAPEDLKKARRNFSELKKLSFQDSWVAHFAHQVFSPVYTAHHEGIRLGDPLPLFSNFYLRRPSRIDFDKSLKDLQQKGIKVYSNAKVKDVGVQGRLVDAIEVASDESGVIRGKQFVWMLTSEETYVLEKGLSQTLFPEGFLKPEWFWTRYRVALSEGPERFHLPDHFIMIDNLHFPWSHENVIVGVRTAMAQNIDFWVRIPYHQRFQRRYLEEMRDRITAQIESRIPKAGLETIDMPLEYQYDHVDVGAPRFPVFQSKALDKFKTSRFSNLYFDSAEVWNRFDWVSQYQSQTPLKEKIRDRHIKSLGVENK